MLLTALSKRRESGLISLIYATAKSAFKKVAVLLSFCPIYCALPLLLPPMGCRCGNLCVFKHGRSLLHAYGNHGFANKIPTPSNISRSKSWPCHLPRFFPFISKDPGHFVSASAGGWIMSSRVKKTSILWNKISHARLGHLGELFV